MVTFVLFGVLVLFLVGKVPVAVALGSATIAAMLIDGTIPVTVVGQRIIAANDSFPLLAVPFFMFAGAIMTQGGMSRRLVNFAQTLVGSFRGGLAMVSTVAAMFFAAISGSSAATTAAVGASLVPAMKEKGYAEDFSAATVAAAGTTGLVIPPSTAMVVYGVVTGTSIGELFMGGFIPGILMGLAMMAVIYIVATKRGYKGTSVSSTAEVGRTFYEALWGILMPVIILGGIYGGIFTPTESAAVACVYGLLVSLFVYKEIKVGDIMRVVKSAINATAITLFILSTAGLFGWFLVANHIPQKMAAAMMSISTNAIVILMIINVFLLFVGMFLNVTAAISILAPIFFPIVVKLGVDPVAFGVIMTVNLAIGCITPPVGVDLFVAQSISGISLEKISKSAFPYMIALIAVLVLISVFPQLITFIPALMKS